MNTPVFRDLHAIKEDARIKESGTAAASGLTVGILLESDEPEKIARYTEKITTRYPTVQLVATMPGYPDASVTMLKFGPKPPLQ